MQYDQYGMPVQEESFLSKLNPLNWNIGSWLKGALAVVGLGFLFNKNSELAESADKYTAGYASKLGDAVGNVFESGKEKISEITGTLDKSSAVVSKKVKVAGEEIEIITPTQTLAKSQLLKDSDGNEILGNVYQEFDRLGKNIVSEKVAKEGKAEIIKKRDHAKRVAGMIQLWNGEVDAYEARNAHLYDAQGQVIVNGVNITPSKIKLELPPLSDDLEGYGADKFGAGAWKNAKSLEKLKLLENNIDGLTAKKPNFARSSLRDSDDARGLWNLIEGGLATTGDFIAGNTALGRALGSDSRREIYSKEKIEYLVNEGKFKDALAFVDAEHKYFEKVANEKLGSKKEGAPYGKVVNDLVEIREYVVALTMKEELSKASDGAYKAILSAAKSADVVYEGLDERVKTFMRTNVQEQTVVIENGRRTEAGKPEQDSRNKKEDKKGDEGKIRTGANGELEKREIGSGKGDGVNDRVSIAMKNVRSEAGSTGIIYDNKFKDGSFQPVPTIVGNPADKTEKLSQNLQ